MKRRFSIATIVLCALLLIPLGVGLFVLPQREFSRNENRMLQQTPDFSLNAIADGSYTADFEQMCSDQVLFRDFWIAARSRVLLGVGNQDIGGVYIGEGGFLFERHTDAEMCSERYNKNLSYINRFAQNCEVPCTMLLVPMASDVLPDLLPDNHSQYNTDTVFMIAQETLTRCGFLDVRAELRALGTESFYRTDHHWTTAAALEAYRLFCRMHGVEPRDFALSEMSDTFRGTLYSKVLLDNCAYDRILLPAESEDIVCMADRKQIPMFDMSRLSEKDQYAVFFGGNYGRVDIAGGSGEKLLIIKDSYANAFVPFLAQDYTQITMIDLRYFNGSVKALAVEFDEVLFLYGTANFARDSNLAKLLL